MQSHIENDNRINSLIETTFKNLNGVIDVNTVVGKPIKTESGEYVVPVSKVTIGIMMGGGEYGKLNIFKKSTDLPYSAGNGAVISIKPCGFLLKDGNEYKVLSVAEQPYEKLLDKATEFIAKLQGEENV